MKVVNQFPVSSIAWWDRNAHMYALRDRQRQVRVAKAVFDKLRMLLRSAMRMQ